MTDGTALERWFKHHGVPQFAECFSARDRLGLLVFVMLSVVAYELGAAPWYEPDALQLLLSVAGVMCFALCIRPALGELLEPHRPRFSWWSLPARAAIVVAAAWLLRVDRFLGEHPEVAINFPLLLFTAISTAVLSSRSLWGGVLHAHPRAGMGLFVALCFAVVAFALAGNVLPPEDGVGVQALAALVATGLVFISVGALFSGRERIEHGAPRHNRRLAYAFPGASLLALWLGLQTAVLPYTSIGRAGQVLLSLGVLSLVLFCGWVRARGDVQAGSGGRRHVFPVFALLFIVAYPALVAAYFDLDLGTESPLDGRDAFLLGVAFHALCLVVAVCVVRLGLDRVVAWAGREALGNLGSVLTGIGRGLPLLLLLTVFLLMQAELWQVAFLTRWVPFIVLAAGMVVVGFVVMVMSSSQQLDGQVACRRWAKTWACVESAARGGKHGAAPPVENALKTFKDNNVPLPDMSLRGKQRLNAVLVIVAYQAIIFLPLALFAAVVFWGLVRLSVPQHVAAEWLFGDKPTDEQVAAVAAPALLAEPWARVAMLLAAFSFLSLTVQIPSSEEQRENFLAGADRGIKQRLAALLVHRALHTLPVTGADEPAPPPAPAEAVMAGR
jgi:hypothetical protein